MLSVSYGFLFPTERFEDLFVTFMFFFRMLELHLNTAHRLVALGVARVQLDTGPEARTSDMAGFMQLRGWKVELLSWPRPAPPISSFAAFGRS